MLKRLMLILAAVAIVACSVVIANWMRETDVETHVDPFADAAATW